MLNKSDIPFVYTSSSLSWIICAHKLWRMFIMPLSLPPQWKWISNFSPFSPFRKICLSNDCVGEGARKSFIRAGLSAAQSARGRLLRLGVPRKFDRHKVLAGLGESFKSTGWILAGGSDAEVLCQILCARSGSTRGGVHAVFVLPASEARFSHGKSPVQW